MNLLGLRERGSADVPLILRGNEVVCTDQNPLWLEFRQPPKRVTEQLPGMVYQKGFSGGSPHGRATPSPGLFRVVIVRNLPRCRRLFPARKVYAGRPYGLSLTNTEQKAT